MLSGPAVAFSGNGSDSNPFILTTADDLNVIKGNESKYFELGNDIEASGLSYAKPTMPFTGSFDGEGHKINNLTIYGTSANTSMFGSIGTTAIIQDVTFFKPTVSGFYANTAVIASYANGGLIENVHVINGQVSGSQNAGGLVGVNQNFAHISGVTIEDSSFNGTLSDTASLSVGGLIAQTNDRTVISNSSTSGMLTATSTQAAGGLVGNNCGYIYDSYSTMDVYGYNSVGGLVGLSTKNSVIETSFARGYVSGFQYIGGLAGYARGIIENCYSTGEIAATYNSAGGIIGAGDNLNIENVYSTSRIYSSYDAGGLIGGSFGLITIMNSYAWNEEISARNNAYLIAPDSVETSTCNNWEYIRNFGKVAGTGVSKDVFWDTYGKEGCEVYTGWSDSLWTLNANQNFALPVLKQSGMEMSGDLSWFDYQPDEPEVIYKTVGGGGGSNGTVTIKETVYVDSGSGSNGTEETPITPGNPIGFGNDIEPESGFNWWIAISGLLFVTLVVAGFYIRKCQKDLNERRI